MLLTAFTFALGFAAASAMLSDRLVGALQQTNPIPDALIYSVGLVATLLGLWLFAVACWRGIRQMPE